jgi:hypothetical protein
VRSSESSCWKPPQTNPPTTPASEGITRTGAWLESMAKRRKAAQATVKRASESLEPRSAMAASARSPHTSMFKGSNSTSPMKGRETRIIPNAAPRMMEDPFVSSPATTHRNLQVVIPFNPLVTLNPTAGIVAKCHAPINGSRSTQSPASTAGSVESTMKVEIKDSCASSVDNSNYKDDKEESEEEEEGEEVFEVECILNERTKNGETKFLVQWAGYTDLQWVSEEDCNCEDLIKKYRASRMVHSGSSRTSKGSHARQRGPESAGSRIFGAERRAEASKKTSQIHVPRVKRPVQTPRDPKTGKFQRKSAPTSQRSPKKRTARVEASITKEAIVPPKNVQANTARFSPRISTPGVVFTRRNETTGKIDWLRGGREDFRTNLGAREKSAMRDERNKVDQTRRQKKSKRVKSKQREDNYTERQRNGKRPRTRDRQTQTSQPPEQPASRQQYESSVAEPRTINTNLPSTPQNRGPIHIRFDDDVVPIKSSPATTLARPSASASTKRHTSCGERLRRARRQGKKSSGPSLLRHEFSGYMSQKHAEALINQTRGSPERAFGFSLPCNSVLLSIEKDDG